MHLEYLPSLLYYGPLLFALDLQESRFFSGDGAVDRHGHTWEITYLFIDIKSRNVEIKVAFENYRICVWSLVLFFRYLRY